MTQSFPGLRIGGLAETSAQGAKATASALGRHYRRVYLIALACATLVCLLSWYGRELNDLFVTWIYPLAAAVFALLFALSLRHPAPSPVIGLIAMLVAAALILSRLAWHFAVADDIESRLLVLAGGHYWAVGILLVACLVALGTRTGLMVASSVLALSALITLMAIRPQLMAGELSRDAGIYLIRIHFFLFALMALASAGTVIRDRMVTALVQAETLDNIARTDLLSGLSNRRAGQQFLGKLIAAEQRKPRPLSVILVDIDHFKQINDHFGHARGDDAIRHVASRLRENLREADLIARWGGEEFLIIAPDTNLAAATELAQRLRANLCESPFMDARITGTFGVTEYRHGDSMDTLISRADDLLYQGKGSGRDRVISS